MTREDPQELVRRCAHERAPALRSLAGALLLQVAAGAAHAGNHDLRINEVMAGSNGDSAVQFVEIVTDGDGEKRWGPQAAEPVGRAMLTFHGAAGSQTGRFVFPSDPPDGRNTVLIATAAWSDLTGVAADFTIPALVTPIAGKVCFRSNPDNGAASAVNLCLSYGGAGYTGATEGAGGANGASLPILGSQSLARSAGFSPGANSNASFALATPTPSSTAATGATADLETNVAGGASMPGATATTEQGRTLFERETFLGNGRTCATCHVEQARFGLPPDRVASLPGSDPLFVHESDVNRIVVSGAGSVLPATAVTQPSDFTLGGVVSGSLGGSATVLAGSGGTYLVVGGAGLDVPGNVISDAAGNTGTLVSFTAGDLAGPAPNGDSRGLEDSTLLRGGRALIVENINGFAEHAFLRGSPSLVNIEHTAPYGLSGGFADLQSFSNGAVSQHLTRSLQRRAGIDFRPPSAAELDAMAAFMKTIRIPADGNFDDANDFDRFVTTEAQKRGRALFFGSAICSTCHAGPVLATVSGVNQAFDTGVSKLAVNAADGLPTEQDVGAAANSRAFDTPGLFGVRDTAPFFHENSAATLLEAVEFYGKPESDPRIEAVNTPANAADLVAFMRGLTDVPFTLTAALDFGDHGTQNGPSAKMTATITNTSNAALTISGTSIRGADAGAFSHDAPAPDGGPFGNGESRTIDVRFDPAELGPAQATLELEVSDGTETYDVGVALTGNGIVDTDGDGIADETDTDDDGDGMPDDYETANGLDPLDPADASEDPDGDGFDNRREFEAGTDPNDRGSSPATRALPAIWFLLFN